MVRAAPLPGWWREPLRPHLDSFQPSGCLSVPWREDWRLPGTQGPTRSLRPTLLGASGLSLGINSLDLQGWGREEEALLRCLQNKRQNQSWKQPPHLEWRFGRTAGSSIPKLGPAETHSCRAGAPGNHLPAFLGPESPPKPAFLSKSTMACSLLVFSMPKL